ncbi:hypothetical protein I5I50_23985 [Pseudomonas aeruginosa]|uniref:hypothetical protein n=1 Tax=Pseudomonas aeruginosa TaxID=287 RepID=UPI00071BADBE|nr:hypothetical protein [Pseudomonas aeruginosa]KSC59751.1 hypothetical protein AO887_07770 [Pseudomonas aeruginosa]MBG4252977.1 hypothetical protein [Pseudomonas aeruginosa]MBG4277273.1 hypothetical protein [Pseudomonas aeruginosa]MBG5787398.1 hypothetical protein [Pseudomonas aeruginosa]MBG6557832.1 hypothetical protein [Pseudomonas aeruginosa]
MQYGRLALAHLSLELPLQVLMNKNRAYYIGTSDEKGPVSRESVEYYPSRELAQQALDNDTWSQLEY